MVSIDAGSRETYKKIRIADAYDLVIKNMIKYSKNRDGEQHKLHINNNINTINVHECVKMIEDADRIGVDVIQLGPTDPMEMTQDICVNESNREIFKDITFTYIKQKSQKGLGDDILQAKHLIKDELFAILLADDLILNNPSSIEQLINVSMENKCSVIGLSKVNHDDIKKYGVISSLEINADQNLFWLDDIVEKPRDNPPSDLAVFGRYVLSHNIFKYLENLDPGINGEIQLTDAIRLMLSDYPVAGYLYEGKKFDCGSKEGYVNAITYLAKDILDN